MCSSRRLLFHRVLDVSLFNVVLVSVDTNRQRLINTSVVLDIWLFQVDDRVAVYEAQNNQLRYVGGGGGQFSTK